MTLIRQAELELHGTRSWYRRAQCRCVECRAANAQYERMRYRALAIGRPLLGSRIPAAKVHILMRALRAEWLGQRCLDRALGWHNNICRVRRGRFVALKTALAVEGLHQRAMRAIGSARLAPSCAAVVSETLRGLGVD